MQGLARPVAQPAQNARSDRLLRAAKHQAALAKYHPPGRRGRPVNTNIRSLKGEKRTLEQGNTIRQRTKLLFQPGSLPSNPLHCCEKAGRTDVVVEQNESVVVNLGGR